MFLIYYDESQVAIGQEQCGTGTQNDFKRFLGKLLVPYFNTLVVGVPGVVHTEFVPEDAAQTLGYLGSQGYLGKEIQHLFPFVELFPDEPDIDFCLPT